MGALPGSVHMRLLCLQMCASGRGGSEAGLISQSALAPVQTDGINRHKHINSFPASTDASSVG